MPRGFHCGKGRWPVCPALQGDSTAVLRGGLEGARLGAEALCEGGKDSGLYLKVKGKPLSP